MNTTSCKDLKMELSVRCAVDIHLTLRLLILIIGVESSSKSSKVKEKQNEICIVVNSTWVVILSKHYPDSFT